jgi:hypothetical protein
MDMAVRRELTAKTGLDSRELWTGVESFHVHCLRQPINRVISI